MKVEFIIVGAKEFKNDAIAISEAINLDSLNLPVEITSKLKINGITDIVKLGRKNNPELEEIGFSKQEVEAIVDSFFGYVDSLLKNNSSLLSKILEYVNEVRK